MPVPPADPSITQGEAANESGSEVELQIGTCLAAAGNSRRAIARRFCADD
jgi:hypothetical protein